LRAAELGEIGAVQKHAPALRLINALDHLHQRRFAAAVAPDDGVQPAGTDADLDAVDHVGAVIGVAEHNILDNHFAFRAFHIDLGDHAVAV
jgi:hypothetical protein